MKHLFALPAGTYLLSHSVGCPPAGSAEVLEQRFYAPWRRQGGDVWTTWLEQIERFRTAVAGLLGASPAAICPQVNLSSALTKIIHGLPQQPGRNRILLCEEDFPSLGFVAQAAQRTGLEPLFLPRDHDPQDPQSWADALDASVRLALVTHAFSNRSARLPVGEITALCAARGITSIVDVAQTAGVVPIDVARWDADFVIGSSVKFLCGGPGAGFLWAAPRAIAASQPVDVGWFSHEEPFEFDIHDFRYAPDARRFWGGTPAVAPYVQAAHSIETLLQVGVERIHDHNQLLISRAIDAVPAGCVASVSARQRRGNALLLRVSDLPDAMARLRAASVFADSRNGCVRVSPHLYNDDADIEQLLRVIGTCLSR